MSDLHDHMKAIVHWDVPTWARAVTFWQETIQEQDWSLQKGLEIGANQGGLSLFFSKYHGAQMFCSDYEGAMQPAKDIHQAYGLDGQMSYHQVDATAIPFEANTFDFVTFKSVLGAIGRHDKLEQQAQAMQEMHRVLKPGGVLFWAENLKGSYIHQQARQRFVPWGMAWRYVTVGEMEDFLQPFSHHVLQTTGFATAFVPETLRSGLAHLDRALLPILPKSWAYVGYGYAVK